MGVLQQIGERTGTDKALWHKYCDFYETNLPDRNFTGRILEIGVWEGKSIEMWKEYYPLAQIVGVDILIRPKPIEGVTLVQINSSDIEALKELGNFDIIIDDGSHMTLDQQISFNWLYNNQLNAGGLYIMEDSQTSFHKQFINSKYTTYNLLKQLPNIKEFNRDNNESITIIIPK